MKGVRTTGLVTLGLLAVLAVTAGPATAQQEKPYVQYPPRKLQSEVYTGPITISNFQKFQWVREQLEKEGISIPVPTGN
jgi:arylsulfatase